MDAITLLKEDHRTVESLFRRYESLQEPSTEERERLVHDIIRELSVHAAIEEQVLYPEARRALPEGESLAEEALDEHAEAEEVLAELDDMEPSDAGFDLRVRGLIADVRHHVAEEENEMFPKLRASLSTDELEDMGRKLERAKSMAPTRPHPHAPSTPPGNLVAGPMAAVVDRVRDAVTGRPTEEEAHADARRATRPAARKAAGKKAAGRKKPAARKSTAARRKSAGRKGPVIHVTADPRGGWRAEKQGSNRALIRSDSKREVVSRARDTAKRQEGRLVIHKENGRIQEERTYGRDPARTRG